MTKNILVVDDEVLLAHTVAEMLRSMGYNNITSETSFEPAKDRISKREAELVLLDINLGNGEEGLELARLCDELKLPFIFISSYSDKETLDKAIGTNPLAYLIKPISEGNLYSTLQLVTKQQQSNTRHTVQFKDGTEQIHLPLENILYLKAENVYVNVVTAFKTYLYRGSLQSFIDKLPQGALVQTHRSYAVNPTHIERIGANYLVIQQAEIPISRSFKHQIQAG
jgi:DNA-binding LytR/AlgR family response regulator